MPQSRKMEKRHDKEKDLNPETSVGSLAGLPSCPREKRGIADDIVLLVEFFDQIDDLTRTPGSEPASLVDQNRAIAQLFSKDPAIPPDSSVRRFAIVVARQEMDRAAVTSKIPASIDAEAVAYEAVRALMAEITEVTEPPSVWLRHRIREYLGGFPPLVPTPEPHAPFLNRLLKTTKPID